MAMKLPYRYKSGNKQYDILNNFTGGISSMYADDIITDKTYREIDNWDIVNGGLLEKRVGTTYIRNTEINSDLIADDLQKEYGIPTGDPFDKTVVVDRDSVEIIETKELRTSAFRFLTFTVRYNLTTSSPTIIDNSYIYDVFYGKINDKGEVGKLKMMPHSMKEYASQNKGQSEIAELKSEFTVIGVLPTENMSGALDPSVISSNVAIVPFNMFFTENYSVAEEKSYKGLFDKVKKHYGMDDTEVIKTGVNLGLLATDWRNFKTYLSSNIKVLRKKVATKPVVWTSNGIIYTKFYMNVLCYTTLSNQTLASGSVVPRLHTTVITIPYISMSDVSEDSRDDTLLKDELFKFNSGFRGVTAKTVGTKGYNLASAYSLITLSEELNGIDTAVMPDSISTPPSDVIKEFDELSLKQHDIYKKLGVAPVPNGWFSHYVQYRVDLLKQSRIVNPPPAAPVIESIALIDPLVPAIDEDVYIAFDINPGSGTAKGVNNWQDAAPIAGLTYDKEFVPNKSNTTANNILWVNVMVWNTEDYTAYNTSITNNAKGSTPLDKSGQLTNNWYPIFKASSLQTHDYVGYRAHEGAVKVRFNTTEPQTIAVAYRFEANKPTNSPDFSKDPLITYNVIPNDAPVNIKVSKEIRDFQKAYNYKDYKGSMLFYGGTNKLFRTEGLIGHSAYTRGGRLLRLNTEEPIVNLQSYYDSIIASSPHKLFVVKNSKEGRLTAVELNKDIGVVAKNSVVNNLNTVFFLSHEGIFKLKSLYNFEDRYNVERVDKPIADQIREQLLDPRSSNAQAVVNNDKYYLFFPHSGICFIYYNEWKGWAKYTSEAFKQMNNVWSWEGEIQWSRLDSPYVHAFGNHNIAERPSEEVYRTEEGTTDDEYYDFVINTQPKAMGYLGNEEMQIDEKLTYGIEEIKDVIHRDVWHGKKAPDQKAVEQKATIKSVLRTKRLTFDGIMHMKKFKQLHVKTFNKGDVERLYAKIYIDDGVVVDTAEWDFEIDPHTSTWHYIHRTKPNIVTNKGMGLADNYQHIDPTSEYDGGETIAQERVVGGMYMDVSGIGETPFNLHKVIVPGKGLAIQYDITHEDETYIAISEIATVYKTKKPKPRIYQSNKMYTK